jgi:hypothetical protein
VRQKEMNIVKLLMVTIKMKALDRFVRARKAVKADRATEQGIAGHQAAMKALSGNWKGAEEAGMAYSYNETSPDSPTVFPGQGHVSSTKDLFEAGDTLNFGHRGTNKGNR